MALTQRMIEAAGPNEKRYWLWDDQVKGFGCRVGKNGSRTYYVAFRTQTGTPRRMKLGEHGVLSLKQARDLAGDALRDVRHGKDPARERREGRRAATVGDLAARYMREHAEVHKKPSSAAMDKKNLDKHVLPRLGARKVRELTHSDIVQMHQAIGKEAPGAANRVVALLSKMLNLAEKWDMRAMNTNPCRHVVRFGEKKVERTLSADDYAALEGIIATAETEGRLAPQGAAAFRLLMTTGCRLSEVLALQWRDVDSRGRRIELRDTKTGGRFLPLGNEAMSILKTLHRQSGRRSIGWVFPRPGREAEPISVGWMWTRWRWIRRDAKLPDLRIHDLRHGFASVAAAQGLSLPMIGALLGHRSPATTARYAHLVDDPLRKAASRITRQIRAAAAEVARPKTRRARGR